MSKEKTKLTPAKESKVSSYQRACLLKDETPKRSWTSILIEMHIGQYPYIADSSNLNTNHFNIISAVCNLMRKHSNVAIAMKSMVASMFHLIDPELREDSIERELNFSIGEICDKDLTDEIDRRRIFKGEDGAWHKTMMQVVKNEVTVDI